MHEGIRYACFSCTRQKCAYPHLIRPVTFQSVAFISRTNLSYFPQALTDLVTDTFGIASANAFTLGVPILYAFIAIVFSVLASTNILSLSFEVRAKLKGVRLLEKKDYEKLLERIDPNFMAAKQKNVDAENALDELEFSMDKED